jgi:hypothetical protein
MDIQQKKTRFKLIQDKIKNNKKRIQVFKRISPYLMFLFMMVSFLTFHNSLTEENEILRRVFVSVLVLVFVLLAFFSHVILKKKEENKELDTKIYHLLKL